MNIVIYYNNMDGSVAIKTTRPCHFVRNTLIPFTN